MTKGRYGIHGGQYVPETIMSEVLKLEKEYEFYKNDEAFNAELNQLLAEYAGRPSLLYYAEKMTKDLGGAKIYFKREDLNHTGSHKINNVLGQALLATSSYFQTQIMVDLYYDKALSDQVMIKSFISLGLTYTFKNK